MQVIQSLLALPQNWLRAILRIFCDLSSLEVLVRNYNSSSIASIFSKSSRSLGDSPWVSRTARPMLMIVLVTTMQASIVWVAVTASAPDIISAADVEPSAGSSTDPELASLLVPFERGLDFS